jgi:phage/plasmid-associated DNA primase
VEGGDQGGIRPILRYHVHGRGRQNPWTAACLEGLADPLPLCLEGQADGHIGRDGRIAVCGCGPVLSTCGGGDIVAGKLYTKNVEFTLTHTPFIQTNNPPLLPPGTNPKADNFRRRIEVFRFPNTYVTADKFDPSNPDHRLANTGLKERMLAPEVLEQLLSLLARESVAYYNEGLGETPPDVVAATRAYFEDCDMLQRFLDEHCQRGNGLETLEHQFADDYRLFSKENLSDEALMKRMQGKGLNRSGKAVNQFGKRELYYPGVKSVYART